MSNIARMMQRATAGAGGAGLDVDEVFSTFVYDGSSSAQTINNGIDLSGEGGLVWIKERSSSGSDHHLTDTVRGIKNPLNSDSTAAENTFYANNNQGITAFNNNGFTVASGSNFNDNGDTAVSWTFRKAPKFFDIVTWTGDGTSGRNISHNLGSVPGHIIVKKRSGGSVAGWINWHRTFSDYQSVFLNTTEAVYNPGNINSGVFGLASGFTSTQFQLGGTNNITYHNENNSTYVAYIFAHNNSDGEFGPDSDQDIIKCGSYTGNGSATGPVVNLGFEPQWVMIKRATAVEDWIMFDNMRGLVVGGIDPDLRPNKTQAEGAFVTYMDINATGFQLTDNNSRTNENNDTYIYMAIRRGPLAAPDDATKVFHPVKGGPDHNSVPFPTDFVITTLQITSNNWTLTRLLGETYMRTDSNNAEGSHNFQDIFADMTGTDWDAASWWSSSATNTVGWHWKRAPSFFDVVAYSGSSGTQNVSHNLGVQPEMIWIKNRDSSDMWVVQVTSLGARKYLNLSGSGAAVSLPTWNGKDYFANTLPTASVFTVGGGSGGSGYDSVGGAGYNYIAYLFATVAGVSKVGSFSHTNDGGDTNVDCGFSSGARFVLYKQYDSSGAWYVLDSVRGIVAGNDPALLLNSNAAEDSSYDQIDPLSSGFTIPSAGVGTGDYIFYAIA